ncbi:unnamed protein product [Arabis nemorensis]|uniref:Uncharacterized protein n=1 Tax=Arabis nemorensis TaxID=586526 RepID=A0A565BS20_9BRAS|nr:unnamed protein product [Arabis nemorensis]
MKPPNETDPEPSTDGAVKAKSDTYSLGSQFDSKQGEKEAWEDCMDLYDQTIHRLNQSVLQSITMKKYN